MSYQKTKFKFPRKSLANGVRGCNKPSAETRAEKLARKAAMRDRLHGPANDHDRVTAFMAGEYIDRRGIKRDRHAYLPHNGEREIARRMARAS